MHIDECDYTVCGYSIYSIIYLHSKSIMMEYLFNGLPSCSGAGLQAIWQVPHCKLNYYFLSLAAAYSINTAAEQLHFHSVSLVFPITAQNQTYIGLGGSASVEGQSLNAFQVKLNLTGEPNWD